MMQSDLYKKHAQIEQQNSHFKLPSLARKWGRGLMLFAIITLLLVYAQNIFAQQGNTGTKTENELPVIPQPVQATEVYNGGQVAHFLWDNKVELVFEIEGNNAVTKEDQNAMRSFIQGRLSLLRGGQWPLKVTSRKNGASTGNNQSSSKTAKILLTLEEVDGENKDHGKGTYHIEMNPGLVHISAGHPQGLFYGLNTLMQIGLDQPNNGNGYAMNIPCWNISDQPALGWRGFMLDESRHFFGKDKVKQLLDWMAFYKLNYFHWHLTDAPGWRLSIKKYPKLTLVGGRGNNTDSTAPVRFYTKEDIQEIVEYAKQRYITVVPEIDMPGHATAANRAYPEMSGGGTGKYANFTFNPAQNKTYSFLTDILKETASLFPAGIVHLGGDEVAFGSKSWNYLPEVKSLMVQNQLSDLKAVETYFLRRMTDSALKFNQKVLAWDEAATAGLPVDKTIIYWWRHDQTGQLNKALQLGYPVVFCPRIPLYFDFVQDSTDKVGRRWKGDFASLQKVFNYWPATQHEILEQYKGQILGIQANLWTETVSSVRRLDYLVFPRMAALATAGWTRPEHRNYDAFLNKLKTDLGLYKRAGINYYNPFDPALTPEPQK